MWKFKRVFSRLQYKFILGQSLPNNKTAAWIRQSECFDFSDVFSCQSGHEIVQIWNVWNVEWIANDNNIDSKATRQSNTNAVTLALSAKLKLPTSIATSICAPESPDFCRNQELYKLRIIPVVYIILCLVNFNLTITAGISCSKFSQRRNTEATWRQHPFASIEFSLQKTTTTHPLTRKAKYFPRKQRTANQFMGRSKWWSHLTNKKSKFIIEKS